MRVSIRTLIAATFVVSTKLAGWVMLGRETIDPNLDFVTLIILLVLGPMSFTCLGASVMYDLFSTKRSAGTGALYGLFIWAALLLLFVV